MARKDLPMGDEHDPLQSAADAALSKDGKPVQRTVLTGKGAYSPEERERERSVRLNQDRGSDRLSRARREAHEADLRRTLLRHERPDLFEPARSHPRQHEPSDYEYVHLAGRLFTKREFIDLILNDLPDLLKEAFAGKTERGKFMKAVMVPAIKDAFKKHATEEEQKELF